MDKQKTVFVQKITSVPVHSTFLPTKRPHFDNPIYINGNQFLKGLFGQDNDRKIEYNDHGVLYTSPPKTRIEAPYATFIMEINCVNFLAGFPAVFTRRCNCLYMHFTPRINEY